MFPKYENNTRHDTIFMKNLLKNNFCSKKFFVLNIFVGKIKSSFFHEGVASRTRKRNWLTREVRQRPALYLFFS